MVEVIILRPQFGIYILRFICLLSFAIWILLPDTELAKYISWQVIRSDHYCDLSWVSIHICASNWIFHKGATAVQWDNINRKKSKFTGHIIIWLQMENFLRWRVFVAHRLTPYNLREPDETSRFYPDWNSGLIFHFALYQCVWFLLWYFGPYPGSWNPHRSWKFPALDFLSSL